MIWCDFDENCEWSDWLGLLSSIAVRRGALRLCICCECDEIVRERVRVRLCSIRWHGECDDSDVGVVLLSDVVVLVYSFFQLHFE